jgi:hypothetical protein
MLWIIYSEKCKYWLGFWRGERRKVGARQASWSTKEPQEFPLSVPEEEDEEKRQKKREARGICYAFSERRV